MGERDLPKDFNFCYSYYFKDIFTYIFCRTRNKEIAEEITQEVFLRAHLSWHTYNSEKATQKTWLWAIARNSTIDWFRSNKKEIEDGVRSSEEGSCEQPNPFATSDLLEALKILPDRQKELLIMSLFWEMSYQEISDKLRISMAAVKGVLFRSKETLKKSGVLL